MARAFFVFRSIVSQHVAKANLNSLREQERHNKKQIKSLKGRTRAKGHKN